ncbi:hypothetical protein [Streptomyces lavenduligriseus]|nr:hypothetical protein [Streptomyces lavenduligriseus]
MTGLVERLADRPGRRTVVLAFSLVNAVAGATVPLVGPSARARPVVLGRL